MTLREKLNNSDLTRFSGTTVRITLAVLHLALVAVVIFPPTLTDIALFLSFYLFTGLGITIGFHRLLAHRGFECSRYLMWLCAFAGTAALQGGPIWWVGVHRRHHQVSDREDDPHSPVKGFWYAHIGWMVQREGLPQHSPLAHDLSQDRFLRWLDRGPNGGLPWLATLAVCFAVGGVSGIVWGAVVRTVFVWHATWSVNSFCHIAGRRPHSNRENSGNLWWVGLWALGEGWHNNHHAFPRAAVHGHRWWEIDLTGYVLRLFEKLGLIHRMVRANPAPK